MNLKSIRENYASLITAFSDAGVKLTESQKTELDTFIVALESKISKQKEATVKATKKIVTEHLEKQYKKVFDSIMEHYEENARLSSKVQRKVQSINESKKIARKVDNYLNLYVESVLPKKTIVDYDRMQKLENLHESLKDMLVVDEDTVQKKKVELTESFEKNKKSYETEIAKLQVKLNESMDKSQQLARKIDSFKAVELLESKTKDLPTFEARRIKKRFMNSTVTEIEKTFDKVLESVQKEIKETEKEDDVTLEEEINDILDGDKKKNIKEDDLLRNRSHNKHISEKETDEDKIDENEDEDKVEEDDLLRNRPHNKHVAECDKNDVYETMETFKFDKDGDIILEDKDVIDAEYMKTLCAIAERLY